MSVDVSALHSEEIAEPNAPKEPDNENPHADMNIFELIAEFFRSIFASIGKFFSDLFGG